MSSAGAAPRRARRAPAALTAGLLALALALAGCSAPPSTSATDAPTASGAPSEQPTSGSWAEPSPADPPAGPAPSASASVDPAAYAVADPGPLRGRLTPSDVLVTGSRPLPARVRSAVARVPGVGSTLPLSLASLSVDGRTLVVAAADPGRFRRFTPFATAQSDEVWQRVAGGEVAVDPTVPERLSDGRGYLRLGNAAGAPRVHVGAYAPLLQQTGSQLPPVSALVNRKRGRQLGLPVANALVVSTGSRTPSEVADALRAMLPDGTTVAPLATEFDLTAPATAVLSGSSVSEAVGTFRYTPHADGTVTPDLAWGSRYIRRETMPILGPVTGNKGMLPQLRAALEEVVRRGLSAEIHPQEYAGCYVPRFIARDPAKGLSLHSWGIAVDLNVPGNQRGTVGEMDRRVVAVFKKWGFAWGGDWNYTDPMHFEMAKVVRVG